MRILLLILGPPAIVAASYGLAMHEVGEAAVDTRQPLAESRKGEPDVAAKSTCLLDASCQRQADSIREQLDSDCQVIARPPWVLAGDFQIDELDRYHQLLVKPIARALSTMYVDHEPTEPIAILLFSSDERFQHYAREFDQRSAVGEYGYFHRAHRRIVVNAATGNGTLAHELTHSLTRDDFPEIPAWFDEGLAALHEQCEFSDDALRLKGLSNWRINVLQEAIQQSLLGSIEQLAAKPSIAHGRADIDYAHARYFCLYLQSRQLLAPYYRKLRSNRHTDPTGIETLKELLQTDSLADTDADFRQWAVDLASH